MLVSRASALVFFFFLISFFLSIVVLIFLSFSFSPSPFHRFPFSFYVQPLPSHLLSLSMAIYTRSLQLAAVAVAALAMPAYAQSSQVSSASTSTVISSLVLNLIIFAVEVGAFFILRARFPKVYRPKTYLGLQEERVAPLSDSFFGWIPQFIKVPTTEILYKNGLDAYQFVAFIEMMVSLEV